MLNRRLYTTLTNLTGEVKIIREDEQAEYRRLPTKLSSSNAGGIVPKYEIVYGGEEYNCCCPFCNDEHYHLYINYLYGTESVVNTNSLAYCHHGCLKDAENRDRLREMILGFSNRTDTAPVPVRAITNKKRVYTKSQPVDNVVSLDELPEDHIAIQYIVGRRGYDLNMLKQLKVGYCPNSSRLFNFYNRIVIPVIMNGVEVGWQARFAGDPPEDVAKYFNAPGMQKSKVIYNFDIAKDKDFMVITEGVMDAWRVGLEGVCLFGKYLSTTQRNLVAENFKQKPVFVMLDNDAQTDAQVIIKKLKEAGVRAFNLTVPPEYKDPGETPTEIIREKIKEVLNGKKQGGV